MPISHAYTRDPPILNILWRVNFGTGKNFGTEVAKHYGGGSEMLVFLGKKRQENSTDSEKLRRSQNTTDSDAVALFGFGVQSSAFLVCQLKLVFSWLDVP